MKIFRIFSFFVLLLLCSFRTLHAGESPIAFDDYKMEDTPREGDTARKVVITTNWEGTMPVQGRYRTHEITVSPNIKMRQGEILSLELVCAQQEKNSNYANTSGADSEARSPTWKISTELNYDPTSYACDLFIIGPHPQRYLPSFQIPKDHLRVIYGETFCFRSIGKEGHFELECTFPNLFTGYWKIMKGKLVIRIPVDIGPAGSEI